MVIWVLFTHIKNIFNGSIMTSPRPKYGEALVAGGLAYSSDVTLRSRLGMNIWPDGGKKPNSQPKKIGRGYKSIVSKY